jgi:hypothetical protein
MKSLDAQILAAHDACDIGALIGLYTQAADETADIDAACFYLTHAYVFALELGSPVTMSLRKRLMKHGRESNAD